VFATTSSVSVELIWEKEIKPMTLPSARLGATATPARLMLMSRIHGKTEDICRFQIAAN
jgi:hypothetical protein